MSTSPCPVGATLPFLSKGLPELSRLLTRLKLGFTPEEIQRIRGYYSQEGRDPTLVELAGIAQSWSEHCSYKSSKALIRRHFSSLPANKRALAMGDAGVMPVNERWAYALRIESHNHPSAIEPYGGAATGIGGILRDVLAMGAKPIALADPLFFGPLDSRVEDLPKGVKHPRYIFRNVVAGIADYGNRVGVPTVSGMVSFDRSFLVNPLVNVACVGMLPRRNLVKNSANRVGERLLLAGGLTGKDGIGGVSFASKELTGKSEKESRPAVQLGNPIMKEPLIHAVLEAVERGLVSGMKDLGGGGLATASGELVNAGGFGSVIHLDRVPLRESGLEPWEIWVSESQERMLLAVSEGNVGAVERIFRLHDIPISPVGEVTEPPFEKICWGDKLVGSLQISFRVDPPLLERPQVTRRMKKSGTLSPPEGLWTGLLTEMLLSDHGASREPVIRLYDHEVQGRTLGKPLVGDPRHPSHSDAALLRLTPDERAGLAISTGSMPWVGKIDAEVGGALAVVEAARNLYAVGARPDAFTDCLNFGNPEIPEVMGDFDSTLRGLAKAARDLNMAVPSGNVSFYNGGLGSAIPPTPVVLAAGLHPDVQHPMTPYFKKEGNDLYLLGRTIPALGGSLYDRLRGGKEGMVPPYDGREMAAMGETLLGLFDRGIILSCHDVSEGGMGTALPEMAFGGGLGFDVQLPDSKEVPAWRMLLAEGGSRWILEAEPGAATEVERSMSNFPLSRIGKVSGARGIFRAGGELKADLDLGALYPRWRNLLIAEGGV